MITLTLKTLITLKTGLDSKTINSNNLYVIPFKCKNLQGLKKHVLIMWLRSHSYLFVQQCNLL